MEVLERLKTEHHLGTYKGVTVLYVLYEGSDKHKQITADYCHQNNWRYLLSDTMFGCEDEYVIFIGDNILPEYLSRGRNGLFLITNRG